ncbi:hypothetical protein A4X09_0g4367 [Tilletia walkeri]|uniref:Zn(2)-C6 fungal-type domain-containing protein n=1 Tax=Tilletia walkeri TaxID=117179 RepID=A0A8X7T4C4_9BASI|nr:hypothetical protein A4X09_0g4367 [Tilletia walkeri]
MLPRDDEGTTWYNTGSALAGGSSTCGRNGVEGESRAEPSAGKSTSKRGKDKDKGKDKEKDNEDALALEKRHRVHFSCSECHRRKQKCDRQQPCSNCITRRIPHLCRTFDPSTDSSDVTTRLARLEKMVGDYLPAILDRLDGPRAPGASRFSPSSNSRRPSGFASAEEDVDEDTRGSFGPTGMYIGSSTNVFAVGTVLQDVPPQEIPVAAGQLNLGAGAGQQDLDTLLGECGWPSLGTTLSPSAILVAALPHRSTCELLLDHFYADINWLRHPIPQRSLRKAFDEFFQSGPTLTLDNLNVFSMLALLCSIASLSIDSSVFTGRQHSRIVATRRLQWAARQALAMSTATGRGDTDAVIAWHLLCRVLILERRQEEACLASGSSVKLALAIGLHRDGLKLKFDAAQTEYRRRIWAAVFMTECYLSWHMGRPSCLQRHTLDSQAPSELDEDGDLYPLTISRPPDVPSITVLTAHRYRFELGIFFLRICEMQQSLRPIPYSDVMAIDRELIEWRDSLPSYLKSPLGPTGAIEIDTSIDDLYPFLAPQRYLLESDFDQSRIGLHRSYLLLSRSKGGSRFLPSRRACVEAAHHDILHRSALIASMKEKFDRPFINIWNVHYHSTKHFSSVAICGIALLSDPNSAQAATLRGHLVHFLEVAILKQQHSPDSPFVDMYQREAQIIKMFLEKADELANAPAQAKVRSMEETLVARKRALPDEGANEGGKRQRSGSDRRDDTGHTHDGDEHATANVLLGLGQAAGGPHATPGSRSSLSAGKSPVTDDAQNILDSWFQGGYQQPANGMLDFGIGTDLASLPPFPTNLPTSSSAPSTMNTMPSMPQYMSMQQDNGMASTFSASMPYMPGTGAVPSLQSMSGPTDPMQTQPALWPRNVGDNPPWLAAAQRNDGAVAHDENYWQTLIENIVK